MRTEEYINELEDFLYEAIEKKDKKLVRRFVVLFIEHHQRNLGDVAHSIELLAQQMSSFQREMNARFEAVDKRFEAVDKRFEAVDKRFEDILHQMDKRFEVVDKRFEDMNKRFTSLQWYMGIGFTMLALLITTLTFLAK